MKNRREAVLSVLDASKPQEYVPAAFFMHFDPRYHQRPGGGGQAP